MLGDVRGQAPSRSHQPLSHQRKHTPCACAPAERPVVDPPEEDEHEREERARALRPGDHMAPATAVKKRRLLRKWMPCRGLFLAFDLFDYYGPIWALNSWVRRFACSRGDATLCVVVAGCQDNRFHLASAWDAHPHTLTYTQTHTHTHTLTHSHTHTHTHTLTLIYTRSLTFASAVEIRRSSCWD